MIDLAVSSPVWGFSERTEVLAQGLEISLMSPSPYANILPKEFCGTSCATL
jgi:hypothetical protein